MTEIALEKYEQKSQHYFIAIRDAIVHDEKSLRIMNERLKGVKELIKTLGPGGGFLFATSHNIEPDTPLENIVALFDAVHEFGRYPLCLD